MGEDLGSADYPQKLIGEELQLDVFDGTDPADTGTRRWWYRSDLSVNNSDAVIRVNDNGNIVDVPVYEQSTTVEAGIDTSFGVVAPGLSEPAFVPMADPADAAFDFARVEQPGGSELALHNRTAPGSGIPDSEDLHLRVSALDDGRATGAITTIPDQTGNGFDLSGNAEIVSSGAFGERSYRFDGSSDLMETTFAPLSQPNHIFASYQLRGIDTSDSRVIWDSASGGGSGSRNVLYVKNGTGGSNFTTFAGEKLEGSFADTSSHIAEALYNGTSSSLYLDDASDVSGNAGTESLDGLAIGANGDGTQHAELDLVELLLYPQDKSSIRGAVYEHLNSNVS